MKKIRFIAAVVAAALLIMGVGYAAWSQTLNITANGKVATLDIHLDPAGHKSTDSGASFDYNAKVKPTSVNIVTGGQFYPGRAEKYEVTIRNSGTLDAVLESLTVSGTNPIVRFNHYLPASKDLAVGQSVTVTLEVYVPRDLKTGSTVGGNFSFTVTPVYSQNP